MALDVTTFRTIIPSRFLSFTIPNPTLPTELLRVAILDSPIQSPDSPRVAALFVPLNRESDWIFCTESGHLQLLFSSPGISRLILIGKNPINNVLDLQLISYEKDGDAQFFESLVNTCRPLFVDLSPVTLVKDMFFDVPILEYEDNLICSFVLERRSGVYVGEMLIEDVEIESDAGLDNNCRKGEFRRRLRFKRMPNLIQTEIRIVPRTGCNLNCVALGQVEFMPDLGILVHSYFAPMVAGLSLIGCQIEDRIRNGIKPKALCLGVGGGALLSFLRTKLNFEVLGMEMDEEVLRVARQYFGLEDSGIQVLVGDALEFFKKLANSGSSSNFLSDKVKEYWMVHATGLDSKFDAIMIDLDCWDPRTGISAPPLELIETHILLAIYSVLSDFGILIMNVILPIRPIYDRVVSNLREIFPELFEIDVGNGENRVLVAKKLPDFSSITNSQNTFLKKIKEVIFGKGMDCIRKI